MGRESLRIQASLSPVEGARIRKELGGRVSESWLGVEWRPQSWAKMSHSCSGSRHIHPAAASDIECSQGKPKLSGKQLGGANISLHQEVSVCLAGSLNGLSCVAGPPGGRFKHLLGYWLAGQKSLLPLQQLQLTLAEGDPDLPEAHHPAHLETGHTLCLASQ